MTIVSARSRTWRDCFSSNGCQGCRKARKDLLLPSTNNHLTNYLLLFSLIDGLKKEPLINSKELTFGMAMGLCSGYLFKKLGKLMMLVVGLGFVSLQLLVNSGYIQVNWKKIERRFVDQFDVDRDGKVTVNDAKHGFRWLMNLLTKNFQFKSTFVGGFVLGFKHG